MSISIKPTKIVDTCRPIFGREGKPLEFGHKMPYFVYSSREQWDEIPTTIGRLGILACMTNTFVEITENNESTNDNQLWDISVVHMNSDREFYVVDNEFVCVGTRRVVTLMPDGQYVDEQNHLHLVPIDYCDIIA